jgi:hypothetical protein
MLKEAIKYAEMNQPEKAFEIYSTAIELLPTHPGAFNDRLGFFSKK